MPPRQQADTAIRTLSAQASRRAADALTRQDIFRVQKDTRHAPVTTAYRTIHAFGVVMLDLHNHSGIGGEATLAILREIDSQIQAIVCSGDWGHPVMQHCQKHGFVRALAKPCRLAERHDVVLR
jgi:DNA-binding NtrC family response regulator